MASVPPRKSYPGRLTRGAGTHLASWLQESKALSLDEAQCLLDTNPSSANAFPRGRQALERLLAVHGKLAGHSTPLTDCAFSGEILVTKAGGSMRLWRASGDFALLRVVQAEGRHVSVHPCGQIIVTGTRTAAMTGTRTDAGASKKLRPPKVWGPAGGGAFSAGKKTITTGVR